MKQNRMASQRRAAISRVALKIVWKTAKLSLYVAVLYFAYKGITA